VSTVSSATNNGQRAASARADYSATRGGNVAQAKLQFMWRAISTNHLKTKLPILASDNGFAKALE
jgi:hypothetical protein